MGVEQSRPAWRSRRASGSADRPYRRRSRRSVWPATSIEQLLQGRPIHRAAGEAAVVVAIPDQPPALMRLALDVGLGSLPLGVEGVEVLFEPLLGRDAGIDRAAQSCVLALSDPSWRRVSSRRAIRSIAARGLYSALSAIARPL